jgi:2'-5' RNA ligase
MKRYTKTTPYQPFIDDAAHIEALDRQRFVVLRAPLSLAAAYDQVQSTYRQRLRGLPVSYPARAHVTLCGFAAGTTLEAVQELVGAWAKTVPELSLEAECLSTFPSPFQIVILQVRKVAPLFAALATLRARAKDDRLPISTVMPVARWTFHMSVAYCSKLDEGAWREVGEFAGSVQVPTAKGSVSTAEVVAFDDGREYSGGLFALEGAPTLS